MTASGFYTTGKKKYPFSDHQSFLPIRMSQVIDLPFNVYKVPMSPFEEFWNEERGWASRLLMTSPGCRRSSVFSFPPSPFLHYPKRRLKPTRKAYQMQLDYRSPACCTARATCLLSAQPSTGVSCQSTTFFVAGTFGKKQQHHAPQKVSQSHRLEEPPFAPPPPSRVWKVHTPSPPQGPIFHPPIGGAQYAQALCQWFQGFTARAVCNGTHQSPAAGRRQCCAVGVWMGGEGGAIKVE